MAMWPGHIYTWGTSAAERSREYACDLLIPDPDDEMFRAVDVEAPPETLFRWICQLRLAPYSYDWIDNLGRQSPRRLVPGLDRLEPGQEFMRIFMLDSFEAGRSVTLRTRQPGVPLAAVTYVAEGRLDGSRLIAKISFSYGGRVAAPAMRLVLPPGDLIMMRRQLLNLKRLAERDAAADFQAETE